MYKMKHKKQKYVCSRCGKIFDTFYMKEICESLDDKIAESGKNEKPIKK